MNVHHNDSRLNLFFVVCLSLCILFPLNAFAETDVTDLVEISQSRLRYNRSSATSSTNVSITNVSEKALLTSIKVVITDISDSTISVANADGETEEGLPYFEFQYGDEISTVVFSPNQSSSSKTITFSNPDRARFSFSTIRLANIISPTLKTISPQFGQPGSEAVLTGYNLYDSSSDSEVYFGEDLAEIKQIYNKSITVVVPDNAGNCNVYVRSGSEDSNPVPFFVSSNGDNLKEMALDVDLVINDEEDFESETDSGLKKSTSRLSMVLSEEATTSDLEAILNSINAQVVGTIPEINLFAIELISPTTVENINEIVTQLKENTLIEIASVNKVFDATFVPNPEGNFDEWQWTNDGSGILYGGNWGQKFAHFPGAWNCTESNYYIPEDTKVKIGIVDSGFDNSHIDLKNVLTTDWIGLGKIRKSDHGNHVAGIIGAEFGNNEGINGVNPFAEMYGAAPNHFNSLLTSYKKSWFSNDNIAWLTIEFGLTHLLKNYDGIKVINMSSGVNWDINPNQSQNAQKFIAEDGAIAKKFADEFFEDVILVVSAGNDSNTFNEIVDAKWSNPFCWAAANGGNNILVVSAVEPGDPQNYNDPSFSGDTTDKDQNGNKIVTDFKVNNIESLRRSNYSNAGSCITIAAPGSYILSTMKNSNQNFSGERYRILESKKYGFMSGTSMAAPMVTGLIGFMYAFDPYLEPSQVIDYLINNDDAGTGSTRSYEDPMTGLDTPVIDAFGSMVRIDGFREAVLDFNNDGQVDCEDYTLFEEAYNAEDTSAYSYGRYDINGDGEINEDDLDIFPDSDDDGVPDAAEDCNTSTCGAYIAPGVWKEFSCYNLAAIGETTNDDPFTPSWRLIGGYWQWGTKGPVSSKWYDTNTAHFAHGPIGPYEEDANDDETDEWEYYNADNGAWSDDEKTDNDPCPSGYRVPTRTQWDGVLDNNTQSRVGTWSYNATNYSSGRFLGGDLMLPTAGGRSDTSGSLHTRGYRGYYWSSTESSSDISEAWEMYFLKSSKDITTATCPRSLGRSVRCISE